MRCEPEVTDRGDTVVGPSPRSNGHYFSGVCPVAGFSTSLSERIQRAPRFRSMLAH